MHENATTIFISTVKLTSDSEVALNKRRTGDKSSFFCVWLFSCINSMSPAVRKSFWKLMVMEQLQSNISHSNLLHKLLRHFLPRRA